MTDAIASFNALIKIGDGATPTEAFTTIAEVMDISGPSLTLNTAEVTSHDSGGWKETIGTILEGGEVSFDINFVPTNATHSEGSGLIADMLARTVRNFQIVFPDSGSTTWEFAALVTGFEPGAPVDGALTASVTLEITGEPTLA